MELVSEPRAFEGEVAVKKSKKYRSSNVNQIKAESIHGGRRRVC
jgi:hypothetical protein